MTSQFSKKTNIILMALSLLGLIAGTVLVLFSNQFLPVIINFLEQTLHRTISINKWISTLQSFFIIPVFVIIFFNAAVFFKYDDTTKTILIAFVLAVIAVMIITTNYLRTNQQMHSDIAAEMMLWRECIAEKSLMPRGWGYSTELRILNTHIFGAIFFLITNNWALVKTLVAIASLTLLALSTLFLLKQLGIEKLWIKLLCITFILAPFSVEIWDKVSFGNYYIPHLSISFCYVALFLSIVDIIDKNNGAENKEKKINFIFFIGLAFIAGLTSIRYLLVVILPIYITMICYEFLKIRKTKISFTAKQFLIENKFNFYSGVGFVVGCVGYLFNNILHKFFMFHQYTAVRFNAIGDVQFIDVLKVILTIFGHRENVSVFTPNGVANVFLHISLILFLILFIQTFKTEIPKKQKILFYFFGINFIFNNYVMMNSEFDSKFYIPVVYYIIPCIILILSNVNLEKIKKYFLVALWSVSILVSSFSSIQMAMSLDYNVDKKDVTKFLLNNGYTFGYASFWNADVVECLTNGKINMACISSSEDNKANFNYYDYDSRLWLSPKRYYAPGFKNDETIFLMVTQDEFVANNEKRIFSSGTQVYSDNFFRVFEYENHDAFRNGF